MGQMAELHVFCGEFCATCECFTLHLVCQMHFQKRAFVEKNTYHKILHSSMFCVTITFKLVGHKTTVIFFYYYFYYSVVYIDFSFRVNPDGEVDSGLEFCCN